MSSPDFGSRSREATCETVMLGRIGRELANVFSDTLQAPLPARLQALVDTLEGSYSADEGRKDRARK